MGAQVLHVGLTRIATVRFLPGQIVLTTSSLLQIHSVQDGSDEIKESAWNQR